MTNPSSGCRTLRLGTRGSRLARWQAEWVANELRRLGQAVDVIEIATQGDLRQAGPIYSVGNQGVFTKEIQRALIAGDIEIAVHSLKDLPTEPVAGLTLAAVPAREGTADVLVCRIADSVAALPSDARVGTGSLRRQAQLRFARPDLLVIDVRGNVETRVQKLDDCEFDALVLAEAGLTRLGMADRIAQVLPWDVMLPAVGQGALGIECRADDVATQAALAPLDDAASRAAVTAERFLLAHLRGGCLAPVGAHTRFEGEQLHLSAVVLSADGSRRLFEQKSASPVEAAELGRRVAEALVARGAAELIAESRNR